MSRFKLTRKNIIGPLLGRVRSELGISQEELANRCQLDGWDIARDTITRIEGGKRLVADYEILLLARALKVNPTLLIPYYTDVKEIVPSEKEGSRLRKRAGSGGG